MVVSGGVLTNNEPIKEVPSKGAIKGACLLCHNGGIGRGLIPPTISVRM